MNGMHVDEIEAVERAALEDMNDAAGRELEAALGIRSRVVGTAFASVAGALPDSAIVANRAIGLGSGNAELEATVDALVALYAEAGVGRYFVHVHPEAQPDALGAWLETRGLEPARAWVKFRRGREAPPAAHTDLDVREATAADADAFGRIECDAFDLGADGAPWLARLVGRSGWHRRRQGRRRRSSCTGLAAGRVQYPG